MILQELHLLRSRGGLHPVADDGQVLHVCSPAHLQSVVSGSPEDYPASNLLGLQQRALEEVAHDRSLLGLLTDLEHGLRVRLLRLGCSQILRHHHQPEDGVVTHPERNGLSVLVLADHPVDELGPPKLLLLVGGVHAVRLHGLQHGLIDALLAGVGPVGIGAKGLQLQLGHIHGLNQASHSALQRAANPSEDVVGGGEAAAEPRQLGLHLPQRGDCHAPNEGNLIADHRTQQPRC